MERLYLPPDFDETALRNAVVRQRSVVVGPSEQLTVSYLDTHDWQLHRSGLVLRDERGSKRRLVLSQHARDPVAVPIHSTPRMAADLPPGHLTDLIGPILGIRALIPMGITRVNRCEGRIESTDGDILALFRMEAVDPLDPAGRPVEPTMKILGLSETSVLSRSFETAPGHDLVVATAARGRRPGDYSSKLDIPLQGGQPAHASMRIILLRLLDALEANIDGTVADIDTEFLHDLRVACRRTRSALTQLKGVLPADLMAPFNTEFKWLGSVTGPLRDLDVYQLEMPTYRGMLPSVAADDLAPLERLIGDERRKAHRSVARALQSRRFYNLLTSWRRTLDSIEPAITDSTMSTKRVAAKRITKAYDRILKKGQGIGVAPPVEALHRLRIDAKKLRYLLEFFRNLYPKSDITARIKELKRLQDILGGFNDMEIQRDRLSDFARILHTDPAVPTSCILTVGRLAGKLEDRQEEFRLAFHDAFVVFSGSEVRAAYGRLFGRRESR